MKKLAEDWFEMIHYDYLGHAGNLTYPYISLFSGDYFNTTVKRTVGKLHDLYSKQRPLQRRLDRRMYKTEMKFWAVLGSRGCREKNSQLP